MRQIEKLGLHCFNKPPLRRNLLFPHLSTSAHPSIQPAFCIATQVRPTLDDATGLCLQSRSISPRINRLAWNPVIFLLKLVDPFVAQSYPHHPFLSRATELDLPQTSFLALPQMASQLLASANISPLIQQAAISNEQSLALSKIFLHATIASVFYCREILKHDSGVFSDRYVADLMDNTGSINYEKFMAGKMKSQNPNSQSFKVLVKGTNEKIDKILELLVRICSRVYIHIYEVPNS